MTIKTESIENKGFKESMLDLIQPIIFSKKKSKNAKS